MNIKKINFLKNTQIIKYNPATKILFFTIDNKLYKAQIINSDKQKLELYIFNFKKIFVVVLSGSQKFIPAKKDITTDDFVDHLASPIGGLVIKINVKEGQLVKKNQTLLIIEAMKMENEIKAKTDSFIKTISIDVSDLVRQDQILMKFEKRGKKDGTTKIKDAKTSVSNR